MRTTFTMVLCLLCMSVQAVDIKVSAPRNGFANEVLNQALQQAQPGDRVVLSAGDYRMSSALRFPRAGLRSKPITLCAEKNAYVALLGSLQLRGWEQYQGNIWRIKHPPKLIKGLYQDAVRLTHPRPNWGKRENPDMSELKTPGTWTQDKDYVYLWTRESDSPDNHRIEASQNWVMHIDKEWIRVEGLHMLFGQHVVCEISADHCEVVNCEIAHCSNSVDNSYNAYFSGCSHSAFRNCLIHDSFYWGDHGSNSHVLSSINAGDRGPNFVDRCEIFNGGLGIGTKNAVRELVVSNCHIYDVVNGVVFSGERSGGPGAGKKDRGHYRIYNNHISDCQVGARHFTKHTSDNRFWNNVVERCAVGVEARAYESTPKDFLIVNNIFSHCPTAIKMTKGRKGTNEVQAFIDNGMRTNHNLFWSCDRMWSHPLNWSKSLDLNVEQCEEQFPELAMGCISVDPQLDQWAYVSKESPSLSAGTSVAALPYVPSMTKNNIGRGSAPQSVLQSRRKLRLSIAGTQSSVPINNALVLQARIVNNQDDMVFNDQDALISFHFRYRGGHMDKQEIYRVRVALPPMLKAGTELDLSTLAGWNNPHNGKLGDAFHLRRDTKQWDQGYRLRATLQFIERKQHTAEALQTLCVKLRSQEVIRLNYKK